MSTISQIIRKPILEKKNPIKHEYFQQRKKMYQEQVAYECNNL
jgi:hypothetical protein